jgi:hypothetical protein
MFSWEDSCQPVSNQQLAKKFYRKGRKERKGERNLVPIAVVSSRLAVNGFH